MMRVRSLWAAVFAVLAGTSSSAATMTCPTPTLSQCASRTYRATTCGVSYDKYCTKMVEDEWNKQVPSLPQTKRLLPENLGGTVETVGSMPEIAPTSSDFWGQQSVVSGLRAANQIVHRKSFKNLSLNEQLHAQQLKDWASNGPLIRSCREYVHEKYLGYSQFEAKVGAYGGDFREIFDAAFSNQGIAHRTLYDIEQKPLAPIFDGESKVEKNAYFLFQPGPYPVGQQAYAFSSVGAKLANDPAARSHYAPSDSWHQQMSKALGNENDDVLDELASSQRAFVDLLADRDAVWESYAVMVKQQVKTPVLDKEVANELRKIDARIDAALDVAHKQGCLDAKSVTRCDWSPRRYHDLVVGAMELRRQQDLSRCLQLTADDFSASSFVRNAHLLKIPALTQSDYSISPSALAAYLQHYAAFIATLDVPIDASTGLTRRGGRHADRGEFGDRSSFAGGIDYSGYWEAEWGSRFCDANLRFGAHATVSGWAFGTGGEIAHVEGLLETEAEDIHYFILARVAGSEVYRDDRRTPAFLDFQVANPTFHDGPIVEGSATFVLVFVPVTVSAGLSANIGMEFRLGGEVARDCALDRAGIELVGTVKPYAGLSGHASLALGIPGLRVGVRGQVLIARVDVPLRGSVGIYLSSSSELTLRLRLALAIRQRYLDGRLSLFGELGPCPFCLRGEVTIVSWPGFGGPEIPLFDEHTDIALARL